MNNKTILPFKGVEDYSLKSPLESVTALLKERNIGYEIEIMPNKGCTPEDEWKVVHAENSLHFFYAKDKLFKIYVDEEYDGSLPNGIKIGTSMAEAQDIDSSLCYDDWNEDWSSDQGYWLEDDIDLGTVMSITIFINELLDDEVFDKYEW